MFVWFGTMTFCVERGCECDYAILMMQIPSDSVVFQVVGSTAEVVRSRLLIMAARFDSLLCIMVFMIVLMWLGYNSSRGRQAGITVALSFMLVLGAAF